MQKRRPARGGVDLLAGDRPCLTKSAPVSPHLDGLETYRALRLIQLHAVRPDWAAMLAALAFGGGAHG